MVYNRLMEHDKHKKTAHKMSDGHMTKDSEMSTSDGYMRNL